MHGVERKDKHTHDCMPRLGWLGWCRWADGPSALPRGRDFFLARLGGLWRESAEPRLALPHHHQTASTASSNNNTRVVTPQHIRAPRLCSHLAGVTLVPHTVPHGTATRAVQPLGSPSSDAGPAASFHPAPSRPIASTRTRTALGQRHWCSAMYLFELATTGTISFGDFVSSAQLVSQVAEATQLRARVRAVLKEHRAGASTTRSTSSSKDDLRSGTDAEAISASDWMRIVTALEEYLPSVVGVFNCVQTDDLLLRYEPVFSWRTSISSTRFRGPQRVELPGLHYELAWVLVTYALALANFAAATVHGLGAFERDRSLSADERRVKDERLRWGADTLCRASGVLVYVSEELLPQWRGAAGAMDVPPDLTGGSNAGAEQDLYGRSAGTGDPQARLAQRGECGGYGHAGTAIAKVAPECKPACQATSACGRGVGECTGIAQDAQGSWDGNRSGRRDAVGLSANHEHELARRVSATNEDLVPGADKKKMFGKLRLGKDKAKDDVPSATTGVGGDLDVSSSLLAHVRSSLTLHRALAYKWLGIDAGENSNRVGEAIVLLTLSSSLLSPSSGLLKRKDQERVGVEAATVEHWLRAYRQLNDTVAFQPVPPVGEVQNKVPAGRAALASKKFNLPTPRFGPGSQGYTGRGFDSEALHALDADHPARANLVGLTTRPTDTYAGHGAYY
ncbi:hypothetical protein L1887_47036 [Cichorium endivia]|nr:hypothetical protein L1887_47036 [Cichorium endivia]